jgi:hypothetical protein
MDAAFPITNEHNIARQRDALAHTIPQAAKASGLSRSMLYLEIGRGRLHARKCGARTLILDSDLRRFLRGLPHFTKKASAPKAAARQPRPVRLRKRVIGGVVTIEGSTP